MRTIRSAVVVVTLMLTLSVFSACSDTADPVGGNGGNGGGSGSVDTLMQITTEGGSKPSVSPSGNLVAFETTFFGTTGMAIFDLRDSTVDSAMILARNPDWSPSEDAIAVNYSGLRIYERSEGTSFVVSREPNLNDPDWNPNGRELVTHGDSPTGLYLTDTRTKLTSRVPCTVNGLDTCAGELPSFSPDGQCIVFGDGNEILIVNRAGGTASALITGLNEVSEPSWSPDGLWVAFSMRDSISNASHIWVVDYRGMNRGLHQITTGEVSDHNPCWGPASDRIYFDRNELPLGPRANIWRNLFTEEWIP